MCPDTLFDCLQRHIVRQGTSWAFCFGDYNYIQRTQAIRPSALAEAAPLAHALLSGLDERAEGHFSDFREVYSKLINKYPKLAGQLSM